MPAQQPYPAYSYAPPYAQQGYAPYGYAYVGAPQQHAAHHNINPIRPMGAPYAAGPYVPRGVPVMHGGVGPVAPVAHGDAPAAVNASASSTGAAAPASTNANATPNTAAASTTTPSAAGTANATSAATTPSVAAPAASTASTPSTATNNASTTPSNATDASKDSLAVPKDSRSSLTSSGETSLQPPIRKAKASTAAAAAASPASTTPAATETKESAKPAETATKTEPAANGSTPASTAPTAASIVAGTAKSEPAKAAAAAKPAEPSKPTAADIVKSSPAAKPTAKPVSLTESLDINFEVEEPAKKTAASVVAAAAAAAPVTPAKSSASETKPATSSATTTTAAAPAAATETKSAAPAAESKPAASAASTATPATGAADKNGETKTAASVVASSAPSTPSPAVLATPEPAPRTPSPAAPVTPVPYKITVDDQNAAKKNEGASVPPGIRVYSAEMLMGFAALAKGVTPPPSLQIALDRARVNSPARGPGGKGAGGAGGKGRGRADKTKGPPPTPVRPVGIDPNSIEAKSRTFLGILNKITPEMFEKLVGKLLEVPVENPETLAALVDIIVNVAVRELKFCAMYANLCSRIAISFKFEQTAEDGSKYTITFRSIILNKCQGLFSDRKAVQPVPDDITDPEQRQEWELRETKKRQHLLGLVKFVAELANQSVLSMNIVPQILDTLWNAQLGYEDLELFTIVLATSGKQLPSAKLFIQKCRTWIKEFTEREVQDSEGKRIRYLMQDVIDLAEAGWVHRQVSSAAQGPKTLDEVREDIAKREKMLENELKNMKRNAPVSGGRLAQPVPTKAGGRGPFSVMQREAPRTPSSPQGGRGKASFTSQSGSSGSGPNGAFSPARGAASGNATPANTVTSPHSLSNAFDSLMIDSQFDPNFLTTSTSSAPRDDSEAEAGPVRGAAEGDMDTEALDEALEEFLDSAVPEDAVETIADGPAVDESCAYFISALLLKVFDTPPDKKRDDWALNLLNLFVKNADYGLNDTERTVVPGLTQTAEQLDNTDSPLAPGRFGSIIGECLNRKIIAPNAINKILAPLAGEENTKRANQVIISMWKRVTPSDVSAMIKQSGFNISAWKIPDSDLPESMKQQMETADTLLKRGVDILEVAVWAKKFGSPALRDIRFIEKAIARLADEARAAATAKTPLDEAKFAPAVSAILSAANNDIQRQIATMAVNSFAAKPAHGVPLFTLLSNNGLPKKTIIDAAEKKGDNYLFDPQFTSWGYSGAAAAAAASSSSGKSGKGGKGKKKK